MKDKSSLRVALSLLGTMAARLSVVVILTFTFTLSWMAASAAAPEATADMMRSLVVVTVYGVGIDIISPFVVVLIAWSVAPLVELYAHRARINDDLTPEDTA